MTVSNKTIDGRYTVVGSLSTATTGPFSTISRNGGDHVPTERSGTPHAYTMSCTRFYQAVYKRWYKWDKTRYGWLQVTKPGRRQLPFSDNDQIKLVNKLRAKMDGIKQDVGVSASELGKTTDMLANQLRQIALATKQARRGNIKEALKTLGTQTQGYSKGHHERRKAQPGRTLSGTQLELQYGYRALANDIYDLSESLSHPFAKQLTVRASHKVRGEVIPNCSFACSGESFISRSIVAYLFPDEEPVLPVRMGLANPAGIIWENVPLSFVLDWALPIGDWIEAQSFALRARALFVTSTFNFVRSEGSGFGSCAPYDPSPWGFAYEPPGRWFYEDVSLVRTVSASLNVPLPSFKSSLLGGEPLARLANAAALIAQLATSSRKR